VGRRGGLQELSIAQAFFREPLLLSNVKLSWNPIAARCV
jgi:hypothetical protein